MSSHVGRPGRLGLITLFSVLVLLLSVFNLSGAAPLPTPDTPTTEAQSGNEWADFLSSDGGLGSGMSMDEAMAILAQLAASPEEATTAEASIKDELTKAKAGQPSQLSDSFFAQIEQNPEAWAAGLGEMAENVKPSEPTMSEYMPGFFSGDQVDTSETPGGVVYDASNDGVAVSDDSQKVKEANPGLMDRFSIFGKSKQVVRWMIASLRALKGSISKAKAANQPLTHDAQIDNLRTLQTDTARTQDAATMSYAEDKAFVILHVDEGSENFKGQVHPIIEKLATTGQFHPAALPEGSTNLMDGLKLDTKNNKFDVKITEASDPAAHVEGQSAVIEGAPETPTTETPTTENPNAPDVPEDPNAVTDPNDTKNKPKPAKTQPARSGSGGH